MKNGWQIAYFLMLSFLLFGLVGAQTPTSHPINLFILTFTNYEGAPEIDWWKEGFVDFLMDYFSNNPDLNVHRINDPATIPNQIKNLSETEITRCYLLTGNYKIIDQIFEVDLELIDINTWRLLQKKNISIQSADMAKIIESVNHGATEVLTPYLIKKAETTVAQEISSPSQPTKNNYQKAVAASVAISSVLDKFSETHPESAQYEPSFGGTVTNELSLKFGEAIAQTGSFQYTINQIVRNPYKLEISDPLFRRLSANDEIINVTFFINYVLSRDLIQDMLTTFPYEIQTKNDEYTEYIFSGKWFAYSEDFIKAIARGDYRTHPVYAFITNTETVACVLIDMPIMYRKNLISSSKVQFTAKYQPLINVTANGWNVAIQLKNTDAKAEYNFDISFEQLKNLSRIDVMFLSEADIQEYLKIIN